MLRCFDNPSTELMSVVTIIARNGLDIANVVVDFGVLGAGGSKLLNDTGSNIIVGLIEIDLDLYVDLVLCKRKPDLETGRGKLTLTSRSVINSMISGPISGAYSRRRKRFCTKAV